MPTKQKHRPDPKMAHQEKRFRKNNLGPDGQPWRSRFSAGRHSKPWSGGQRKQDSVANRPNMLPFVQKIISTHNKCPKPGMKRICAVVKMLGITKTVHMDVPKDFNV